MSNYSPRLTIGVEHTKRAIEPVVKFLDDVVEEGTKIGTEAYVHPLTHMEDHWSRMDSEFPEFYNAIGDFVKSKGGLYIPLQEFRDFRNYYRHVFDEEFKAEIRSYEEKFRQALNGGGINTDPAISPWDYMFNDDGVSVDSGVARIIRRLNLKQGIDTNEDRDNKLVKMTREHEPEYIIVGWNHVPALMVEYPNMEIKIIR